MPEPVVVTLEEPSSARASDVEVKALVRIEELRLQRTHVRTRTTVIVTGIISGVVILHTTCQAACGPLW
jgi:hypothetical protein